MKDKDVTSRRTILKLAGAAAGMSLVGCATGGAGSKADPSAISFENEAFYDAEGKFDEEKAKEGVVTLCQYHGYPVFPGFKEKLWVSDYGTGEFTKLGLAAYLFINNEEDKYMLMDLFLLPNQMLPEHWHLDGGANPPKREGWLVRSGLSHIVGIGEPNLSEDVVVPKCHWGGKVTTKHEVIATPGTFVPLTKVLSRHWQYAGPEGAIITEVANVHTDAAVRHSDPILNDFFLKGS